MKHLTTMVKWSAWLATALLIAACAEPAPGPQPGHALGAPAPLVWPKAPAPERIRYVRSVSGPADWGISRSFFRRLADALSGRGAEVFQRPAAVAERDGVLYVADPGAQAIWILDAPRDRYARVTHIGGQALVSPVALALGPDGAVFVADTRLKQVFRLDRDGALMRSFATQGLERPAGLAWDAGARQLYVLDSLRNRIAVFDGNGALLRNMGAGGGSGDGQFNHATHLSMDADGVLLVTDALNFRIQMLDREGRFVAKFGQAGTGAGDFAAPKGVAVDGADHYYVVDALCDVVQIFDKQGQLLLAFGGHGDQPGQFSLPAGIFISADDNVYVADAYNQRVQVFLGARASVKEATK